MARQKIYTIWSNPIFRDSLRILLAHPEILWLGDQTDINRAVEDILQQKPDTVLVESGENANPAMLIHKLEKKDFQLQIIGLNIDTNEVILFHRDYRSVFHERDLLHFVLSPFVFGGIHDDQ